MIGSTGEAIHGHDSFCRYHDSRRYQSFLGGEHDHGHEAAAIAGSNGYGKNVTKHHDRRGVSIMAKPKIEAMKLIGRLPDDASFEDIQYHLYVRDKVERGLRDLGAKKIISQREAERRMAKWLSK